MKPSPRATGRFLRAAGAALLFGFCALCSAETDGVVVEDLSRLRALSRQHLGDPDLWEMILNYNGYAHLSELRPGTRLRIPRREYDELRRTWDAVDRLITDAGQEGAAVLAPDLMDAATELWTHSKRSAFQGRLAAAAASGRDAAAAAEKALSVTRAKIEEAVSAVLARKQGVVESRKPEKPAWLEAAVGQEFMEMERVRTLAESYGEILFIDGGTVRLAEHSLTVIGVMRKHRIMRRTETRIQVLRGDIRVQLASLGGRNRFSLETPEANAAVDSLNFLASRDRRRITRIANYDGEIHVSGGGGAVTVGKNEGTRIESGKPPLTPKTLLPFPELISPASGAEVGSMAVSFRWHPVPGAAAYGIEIAADPLYGTIEETVQVQETRLFWEAPKPGRYFFRIHSVDGDGLVGPTSPTHDVLLFEDRFPPYLVILEPKDGAVYHRETVTVSGMTEPGATLEVNNIQATVAADGGFSAPSRLIPGENRIAVVATDAAGNRSSAERRCVYDSRGWLVRLDVPENLIVNVSPVPISGECLENTQITINGVEYFPPPRFHHLMRLSEGRHSVTVTARHPLLGTQTVELNVTVDLTPPEIVFDGFPQMTQASVARLSGRLAESGQLFLENRPVTVTDGRFSVEVPLVEGENALTFRARDVAGNETIRTAAVFRDTLPPTVTGCRPSRESTTGAEVVVLEIDARDDGSGLARSAVFELSVADARFRGTAFLKTEGRYVGEVFIPPAAAGRVRVTEVRLQDRMGNLATGP